MRVAPRTLGQVSRDSLPCSKKGRENKKQKTKNAVVPGKREREREREGESNKAVCECVCMHTL